MKKFIVCVLGVAVLGIATSLAISACKEKPVPPARPMTQAERLQQEAARKAAQEAQRDKEWKKWQAKQAEAKRKEEAERQVRYEAYLKKQAEEKAAALARLAERKKPTEEVMLTLPVSRTPDALIVEPGTKHEDPKAMRDAGWRWISDPEFPPPSKTFLPEAFTGAFCETIEQVAVTTDGTLILATGKGAYLLHKDGTMQVIGKDKSCTAVAVSPTGDIACAFVLSKERKLTSLMHGREPYTTSGGACTVNEIHVVGQKPYTILFGQHWRQCNESIHSLSYNADGSLLGVLSYPDGTTVLSTDKALRCKTNMYTNRLCDRLHFHPTDPQVFVCSGYRIHLGTDGKTMKSWTGGDALFAPQGNMLCVHSDWENFYHELDDGEKSTRMEKSRHCGVDQMVVGTDYVAYSLLDHVCIWDRKSQKVIHTFRNTTCYEWSPGYVESLCYCGKNLLVASQDGQLVEWDPATGTKVRIIVAAKSAAPKK